MAKRVKKQSATEIVYNQYFNCVQVNMMDLNKIAKEIDEILASLSSEVGGVTLDERMKQLVAKYKQ